MPKALDLTPDTRFVGLFVGKSGSGKTVAEGSFPAPIKVLDFDGRIRGLLGAPWIDRSQIDYDYFPPKSMTFVSDINKVLEGLIAQSKIGQQYLPKTLVLDSLTSQCFGLIQQALPLTHSGKGKMIGGTPMPGPEDYGFEANTTYSIMSFLRSLPIPNIIVSAHLVDRYGKPPGANQEYADSVVVGEKLSLRDKISENIQIYFDHVFRFDRKEVGNSIRFKVKFWSDIARTSYAELPAGEHDITGKNFYQFMMELIQKGK